MWKPNTRNYFPSYFLEHNETIEKKFPFQKIFSSKIILYSKNILHQAKHNLHNEEKVSL